MLSLSEDTCTFCAAFVVCLQDWNLGCAPRCSLQVGIQRGKLLSLCCTIGPAMPDHIILVYFCFTKCMIIHHAFCIPAPMERSCISAEGERNTLLFFGKTECIFQIAGSERGRVAATLRWARSARNVRNDHASSIRHAVLVHAWPCVNCGRGRPAVWQVATSPVNGLDGN